MEEPIYYEYHVIQMRILEDLLENRKLSLHEINLYKNHLDKLKNS